MRGSAKDDDGSIYRTSFIPKGNFGEYLKRLMMNDLPRQHVILLPTFRVLHWSVTIEREKILFVLR
jgi:hypothetical protein